MKYPQRAESKKCHAKLCYRKEKDSLFWKSRGKPATHQAANSKSQHERRYNDRNRLRIDSINRKERPLPNDLINQRWHARNKKEQTQENRVFLSAGVPG